MEVVVSKVDVRNLRNDAQYMVKSKRFFFNNIFFSVLVFLFVYSPPFYFLPVNVSLLMTSICCLLIIRRNVYFLTFKYEFFFLYIVCAYSLFASAINSAVELSDVLLNTPFILLFFNFPLVLFLYDYMLKLNNYNNEMMYRSLILILINVACFSGVVSIILWLNADLNDFIKFEFLKYDRELLVYQSHRGFGLSDELLFSFSIVQASILLLAIERFGVNLRTIVLALLVFFSIALNARIGFLLLPMVLILPRLWSRNSLFYMLFSIPLIWILIQYNIDSLQFIIEQFKYFIEDLTGNSNVSSKDYLFEKMLFLPESTTELFFGSGENIFSSDKVTSDSGYVLLVFYGGLIYLFLILIFIAYCLIRASNLGRAMPLVIMSLVFAISNIKGLFFAPKPGMHLFLIVYVFLIMTQRNNLSRK